MLFRLLKNLFVCTCTATIVFSASPLFAHAMGKHTIAEFVEDKEILKKLVALGVDYVQGFGIAKPMPLINEQTK
jgi:EAL domain-containing protein (putative c-di-GMP-specific phosphodiesterase class I)